MQKERDKLTNKMNLFDCTSPRFIRMSAWLPMCLNPVSVSVKLTPSALAMVLRILEDTVEARKWIFSSGTLLSSAVKRSIGSTTVFHNHGEGPY